jgi:hypothetical protein
MFLPYNFLAVYYRLTKTSGIFLAGEYQKKSEKREEQ